MAQLQRFPLVQAGVLGGTPDLAPLLPLTLISRHNTLQASGLVDSGATVSVLPYDLGVQLDWRRQRQYQLSLTGNLGKYPARGVAIDAVVSPFPAIRQFFAWTRAPRVPLILGRINFFLEFDVCFFVAKAYFEVQPKQ